jgi:hypothetical protein
MTVGQRRKKRAFFQQVQRLNCGRRRQLDEDERFNKAFDYDEDYDWEAYGAYGPIVGRTGSSASSSSSGTGRDGDNASQYSRVRHVSSRLIEGFETKLLRSFRRRSSSRVTKNGNDDAPSDLELHVKVPLGLEGGNTMIVVLPPDHDLPALRVPVKVPPGLQAGDEFVVPDASIMAAVNKDDDDDEGSLSSLVESIVENPPCSLPGLEHTNTQKQLKPSWATSGTTATPAETSQDSVVDLSAVFDDFFTPTPEVLGYYRRTV